jgi:ribosome biogenesis GTPase / thiamine phosphate phosphatase
MLPPVLRTPDRRNAVALDDECILESVPETPDIGYSATEAEAFSDLGRLGFGDAWAERFIPFAEAGLEPGRVVRVDRGMPLVATAGGLERVQPATHLVKSATAAENRAVVGDWVAIARPEGHEMPVIEAVLPRTSAFVRRDPGAETGEQVVLANVDVVFVAHSLSTPLNIRRLERELVLAYGSGALPVVVLTKADLVADSDEAARRIAEVAPLVDVLVESAVTGLGIEDVRAHMPDGTTSALLGASGVGKSTLVNRLVGAEILPTGQVRERDGKGRHVTVAREMVVVPAGGVVIDTPGMRGLALHNAREGFAEAFADVEALAEECRFADCAHENEPGCAVRAAVDGGELSAKRLASYRDLRDELAELAHLQEEKAWRERERAGKSDAPAHQRFTQQHASRKRASGGHGKGRAKS